MLYGYRNSITVPTPELSWETKYGVIEIDTDAGRCSSPSGGKGFPPPFLNVRPNEKHDLRQEVYYWLRAAARGRIECSLGTSRDHQSVCGAREIFDVFAFVAVWVSRLQLLNWLRRTIRPRQRTNKLLRRPHCSPLAEGIRRHGLVDRWGRQNRRNGEVEKRTPLPV